MHDFPTRAETRETGAPSLGENRQVRQGKPLDPSEPPDRLCWSCPLAIYHLHVKNISREQGRSIVAAAAYRAGECLMNEAEEKLSNFGGRREIVFTEIRLPDGAPTWMRDREALWNAVEKAEIRKDARLAKEVEFALPRELPRVAWVEVARAMADHFLAQGLVADLAIHEDGQGRNPHVHILLTTRQITAKGFGPKIREADKHAFIVETRAKWATIANAALAGAGIDVQIDARSHAARGQESEPGKHRGPDRAERAARRARGRTMDLDTLEARRELLADKSALERFPLLRARGDWPPESPEPPSGLNAAERAEHKAFWREVTNRQLGIESEPSPEREAPTVADRAESLLDQLEAKAMAIITAETSGARARRENAELEAFSQGFADLRQTILELRAENARNAAYVAAFREQYPLESWGDVDRHPVPGPDGEPMSPTQRDAAEDAMLAAVEAPTRAQSLPPRPERLPQAERISHEEAVLRDMAAKDPDLAWLNDTAPSPEAVARRDCTHEEDALLLEPDRQRAPERDR